MDSRVCLLASSHASLLAFLERQNLKETFLRDLKMFQTSRNLQDVEVSSALRLLPASTLSNTAALVPPASILLLPAAPLVTETNWI